MKRFDLKVLGEYAAVALVLLAVLAWPSEGWSRGRLQVCEVHDVQRLLDNWAKKLSESTVTNPEPVVGTYEPSGSVLLPTCANGPSIGHTDIRKYFVEHFLANKPVVKKWERSTIGGDCTVAFASGLYTFSLNGGTELRARYTYIFRHGLITQHHSSLEPESGATCK